FTYPHVRSSCLLCVVLQFPCFLSFFFFQAEDGIRDFHVTGVQTCALPIYAFSRKTPSSRTLPKKCKSRLGRASTNSEPPYVRDFSSSWADAPPAGHHQPPSSAARYVPPISSRSWPRNTSSSG